MAKESFAHPETRQLFNTLEDISRRSGVSRGQAFEDVLWASVAALAAETMEPEYFEAIKAHTISEKGKRGVDLFPVFFAQAIDAMSDIDIDVLGDLFQGAISHGENGLYVTPQPIAELMARISIETAEKSADGRTPVVCDPCCGTGILLLEAGKISPQAELVGQDVDARCSRITAINLGLRSKYGWVICGNTLSRDVQFVYRIGSFFHEGPNGLRRGVIRQVPPEQCPVLPEIRQITRKELSDQLDDDGDRAESGERPFRHVIEVPQWLSRLEQRQAALEKTEPSPHQSPEEAESSSKKGAGDSVDDPGQTQRRLF